MMNFFKKPNLPDNKVTLALCGQADEHILNFIRYQGIKLILSENNKSLDKPIENHIDINVHHLGGKNIIIDKKQIQLYKILSDLGMCVKFTGKEVRSPYPNDCLLNCFIIKDLLFCKSNSVDKQIIDDSTDKNIRIIDIKQGYSKCSVLLLSDNSFITDDLGILEKGKENGIDCLYIEKGDILLNGYNYGFIGGASALIDKNKVLFFGDITRHSDFEKIDKFLYEHNIRYIYTNEFQLTDIGGIIQLS